MQFLGSKLLLGQLYTDDVDMGDANDNTTRQTEQDCIGSLPNEPKIKRFVLLAADSTSWPGFLFCFPDPAHTGRLHHALPGKDDSAQ